MMLYLIEITCNFTIILTGNGIIACSSQVWEVTGSIPGRVIPSTLKLVSTASLSSTWQIGDKVTTSWLGVRIVGLHRMTYLHAYIQAVVSDG